jgi:hypothetical protein
MLAVARREIVAIDLTVRSYVALDGTVDRLNLQKI